MRLLSYVCFMRKSCSTPGITLSVLRESVLHESPERDIHCGLCTSCPQKSSFYRTNCSFMRTVYGGEGLMSSIFLGERSVILPCHLSTSGCTFAREHRAFPLPARLAPPGRRSKGPQQPGKLHCWQSTRRAAPLFYLLAPSACETACASARSWSAARSRASFFRRVANPTIHSSATSVPPIP